VGRNLYTSMEAVERFTAELAEGGSFWNRYGFNFYHDRRVSPYADGTTGLNVDVGVEAPYWFVALVLAVTPAARLHAALRRRQPLRRLRACQCPICGYDLRASAGKCPECGEPIAPALPADNRIQESPQST
jgi:hypothetical protein